METYTPTPVEMTDVSLPQDAIDQLVVSTVRTALEPMADGIAFLNQEAGEIDDQLYSRYTGNGSVTINDNAGSPYLADEWYELTAEALTSAPYTQITVGANAGSAGSHIQLGTGGGTAVGWWRVSIDAQVTDITAGVGTPVEVWLGTTTTPTDGAIVAKWRGAAADSSELSALGGEYLFEVTDDSPAPKLSFRVKVTAQRFATDAMTRRIYITQTARPNGI